LPARLEERLRLSAFELTRRVDRHAIIFPAAEIEHPAIRRQTGWLPQSRDTDTSRRPGETVERRRSAGRFVGRVSADHQKNTA
jgi:hypothetical protein